VVHAFARAYEDQVEATYKKLRYQPGGLVLDGGVGGYLAKVVQKKGDQSSTSLRSPLTPAARRVL